MKLVHFLLHWNQISFHLLGVLRTSPCFVLFNISFFSLKSEFYVQIIFHITFEKAFSKHQNQVLLLVKAAGAPHHQFMEAVQAAGRFFIPYNVPGKSGSSRRPVISSAKASIHAFVIWNPQ